MKSKEQKGCVVTVYILINFCDFSKQHSLSRIKANKETPKGKVVKKGNDISKDNILK